MNRTLYYCINGIMTRPGGAKNWTSRMNSWVNRKMPDGAVSDRYEYFCDIFFRNVNQRKRADEIAAEVSRYRRAGYRIVLVGHSNGCALIGEVLNACGQEIDAAHLFAPAAEDEVFADCIRDGLVRKIHIYGSPNDSALLWAKRFGPISKYIPWMGKYGTLGLRGKEFAGYFPLTVKDHSNAGYDHGTWFDSDHADYSQTPPFNSTMELLKRNDLEDQAHPPSPPPCALTPSSS